MIFPELIFEEVLSSIRLYLGSNLKGAKFDNHVSINIEGGIVISAIDPDFDALSSLVYEYNNQPLAKDREFCLRSLVQRF